MAAPGEFQKSFEIADVNPYVDADFTVVTNAAKISGGGLKDAVSGVATGPAKAIYTGQLLDRSADIVARIEIKEGGDIWNDPFGPGLFVEEGEDEGNGYWLKINGNNARFHKVDDGLGGALLDGKTTGISVAANDVFELRLSPAGLLTGKQNDTTLFTTTISTYLDYVLPSAASSWENSNAHTILSFGADGIVSDALSILDVNGSNTITSTGQIIIACTQGDTVTGVTLGGVALTITQQTFGSVTCAPFDIHTTAWHPGQSVDVVITDGATSPSQAVTLLSEPGYIYTVASSIDATYGLLGQVTGTAVAGDGYDGQSVIDISTVTYEEAGPHRNIDPALNNGVTSTGWWYDADLTVWEEISEETYQPYAQSPVWNSAPTPPNCTVGVPYVYDLTNLVSGDRPMTYTNVGSAFPAGIDISGETLAGTPTESGEFVNLQLRATNGA